MRGAGQAETAWQPAAKQAFSQHGGRTAPEIHRQALQVNGTSSPMITAVALLQQRPVFDLGTFRQMAAGA